MVYNSISGGTLAAIILSGIYFVLPVDKLVVEYLQIGE